MSNNENGNIDWKYEHVFFTSSFLINYKWGGKLKLSVSWFLGTKPKRHSEGGTRRVVEDKQKDQHQSKFYYQQSINLIFVINLSVVDLVHSLGEGEDVTLLITEQLKHLSYLRWWVSSSVPSCHKTIQIHLNSKIYSLTKTKLCEVSKNCLQVSHYCVG